MSPPILDKLQAAVLMAADAHEGQFRKGIVPIPYVTHCIEVMKMVSRFTLDEDVLCAAVLHDTLEDTDVSYEMLVDEFGERVASLVEDCTRIEGDDATPLQKELFLKSFLNKNLDAVIIKLCDRYSNCMDYAADGRLRKSISYQVESAPVFTRFRNLADCRMIEQASMLHNRLQLIQNVAWEHSEDVEAAQVEEQ